MVIAAVEKPGGRNLRRMQTALHHTRDAKSKVLFEPLTPSTFISRICDNCFHHPSRCVRDGRLRERRLGKPEALGYSSVKIRLSRNEARAYADGDEPPESMMRRHLVRGHFKVRKSGVSWWRPFLRGSYSWASSLGDSAGTARGH
jgi:hypothetical protein